MSRIRLEDNERRERTEENISLIVEGYWEVIKQLTTALLNLNGFKSYSQDCLIVFLDEFYDYNQSEVELMDQLRRLRNDIDYRGEFLDIEYLERNEESINAIIQKLDDKVEEKL
jgi:N-acyl-D-aspartate/D-glutamate deacylase